MTSPLDPTQASASAIIQAQLTQWGLQSLAPTVNDLIRQGYGSDAITLQLQASDAYKQRFRANDARVAKGLSALTPADYIAAENSYRQVLQQNGLPSGYFDSQDDYDKYLTNDVSPAELNDRAKVAQSIWLGTDSATKQVWSDFYGLSDGHAIAAILDPDASLPKIQQEATVAQAGAAARADGLTADQGRLENYAAQGYTVDQQRQAFTQVGQTLGTDQSIAHRFGQSFTQADSEAGALQGNAAVLKRQQQMYASESALFSGRSSADGNTNSTQSTGSY